MKHTTASNRQGAALVMAIILLGVLVLLGTPFLLSQSGGLETARAYSRQVHLQQLQASGEAIALDLTSRLQDQQLVDDNGDPGADLHGSPRDDLIEILDLGITTNPDRVGLPAYRDDDALQLDVAQLIDDAFGDLAPDPDLRRLRIAIRDHDTRLDPRALDVQAWDKLLQAAGIVDWDDNTFPDDEQYGTTSNGDPIEDDGDDLGELAEALAADAAIKLDESENLDGLLQTAPRDEHGNLIQGFREPLSRAELDRLRPYLSPYDRGWGLFGSMDLGTIAYADDLRVLDAFDSNVYTDMGLPSALINEDLDDFPAQWSAPDWTARNQKIAITDSPGPLNLSDFSSDSDSPLDKALSAFKATITGSTMPDWLLAFQDSSSLPSTTPVTSHSSGIYDLEIAASTSTPSGSQIMAPATRLTMQVPPSHGRIERHWHNQASFEQLVQLRFANLVTSWPEPVRRDGVTTASVDEQTDFAFGPAPFAAPPGGSGMDLDIPSTTSTPLGNRLAGHELTLDGEAVSALLQPALSQSLVEMNG
ncbi:MAG: hypothetical protein ACOCXA_07145, partial [Planctomycetota bacterium]